MIFTKNLITLTMKIKPILILILTVFISINSYAKIPVDGAPESGKITGIVTDASDNEFIPYATIVLFNKADSVQVNGGVTDDKGFFKLDKIPEGEYYMVINYIGYQKKIINDISVKKGMSSIDLGTLKIDKAVTDIEEVEIIAEKDVIEYKIDKKVINVSKKSVAAGGTVVDALENTPSVQIDAEGNVSLRGSSNFTVLIDGKPTALKGNDALKSIPATAVENVELITNPSAKYDPDGTSGIINIIMKKDFKTGVNGIVNASIGTGLKYNGDFTINYRKEKLNYFIGASYNNMPQNPSTEIDNEIFYNDTTHILTQTADRNHLMNNYNIKAGVDFYLDDSNTLTFSGDYGYWGFNLDMDTQLKEYTAPVSVTDYKRTLTELSIGGNYVNSNLTFDHDFSKAHDLVTSLTFSSWNGNNFSDVNEQSTDEFYLNPFDAYHNKSDRNDLNKDFSLKLDYTKPFGEKNKLEIGIQSSYFILNSDYTKSDQAYNSDIWIEQPEFTNEFEFYRLIHSAYTTFSSEFKEIQYQLGLRGEYTDRLLSLKTTDNEYSYEKFDIYPTVHLTKQLPKEQQLQAGYSKRINRPQPWNLNPFPIYSDSYTTQAGNPELLPEYTDSYELNYMKRFKIGFAALEAYYRQTNNGFERTINLSDDGIIQVGTENLNKNFAYGAELSGNFRFNKWLNIYASANIYSYNIQGEIVTETATVQSIKSDYVLNSTISFTKSTRLQLTGFYNAPTITPQGYRSEMYGMNAAISQDFFKNRLSVVIRGRDILKTMKFKFETQAENINTNFVFNMEYPVIVLNISYKINNYKKRQSESETPSDFGGGIM